MNASLHTKAWCALVALALTVPVSSLTHTVPADSISGATSQITAQPVRSDSFIRSQLEDYGIRFTANNRCALLMSGQEKFDDMFLAIRQAHHSVHLEYFNFRNDSIASLLFDLLK